MLARRGAHDAAAHLIAEALAVAHRIEQTTYQAIADMDAHQTTVTTALAAKSNAERAKIVGILSDPVRPP